MIQIVRSSENLAELTSDWNRLAERFRNPLLRAEWFAACAATLCPSSELRVVVNRTGDQVTAIAPLVAVKNGGRETLELLGSSLLYEPSGLLYRDRPALSELLGGIRQLKRPLLLQRLGAGCAEIRELEATCRGRSFFVVREAPGSPWIPICSSFDRFEAQLPARRRSDLQRARRRAAEFGNARFEVLAPGASQIDELLPQMMAVEASGWKGASGGAMLRNEAVRCFFSLYARSAAALGLLRVAFLRINRVPAAFQLMVEWGSRLWVLKIGYDESWARCSPGILLMHESIRYAFDRGLEVFEFLGTDEPWIRLWTGCVHRYVSARLYPFSMRALVEMGSDLSRSMIRRVAADKGAQ